MKVSLKEIKEYAQRIKQKFNPKKIILFGSYAYGKPTKDSDVDILVIMDTKLKPVQQALLIREKIPPKFALDLLVRRPQDIEKRIKLGDFFLSSILKKGKIL